MRGVSKDGPRGARVHPSRLKHPAHAPSKNLGRSTTLANETGARQALSSSPEAGDANPTLELLDNIAGAFGVRLGELVGEK